MKKLSDLQVVFMQKLRSCLTTLKSYFDRNPKPVFDIKSNECGSIYAGQTSWHVITRISEHQKKDSLVGQYIVEYSGSTNDFEPKILYACSTGETLMPFEVINISTLKQRQHKCVENSRRRELTRKY